MTARIVFVPSSGMACGQCPWRLSNQGTRHPGGWYSLKNLRRLWGGLRRGERMTCHPTDPDNAWEQCECHEPPPPGTKTRECAGALVVIQRELHRVQETLLAGGEWIDYKGEHPKGLTKVGAYRHAMQLAFGEFTIIGGTGEMSTPNLNDMTVGHPDLEPWTPVTS